MPRARGEDSASTEHTIVLGVATGLAAVALPGNQVGPQTGLLQVTNYAIPLPTQYWHSHGKNTLSGPTGATRTLWLARPGHPLKVLISQCVF